MRQLLLALSLFALSITAAKAEPEVFVTNGPNKPVPVTVTGETTGTITGDVNVTNDNNSPVPVTVQESTEYVRFLLLAEFNRDIGTSESYVVPDGKELLLDAVSCWAPLLQAQVRYLVLRSPNSSTQAGVLAPIINKRQEEPYLFQAYQLLSGFVDDELYFEVHLPDNPVYTTFSCRVSGRLVDLE